MNIPPNYDLFTPAAVAVAQANAEQFTDEFLTYLGENLHVYQAFEREALAIRRKGYQRYSSRTIVEFLRHHTALSDTSKWKLNDHAVPYLSRLFVLMHPDHSDLFEFRAAKSASRDKALRTGAEHGR